MRVIVIRDDGVVTIDGRTFAGIDMSSLPSFVHALDWNDTSGDLQCRDPANNSMSNWTIHSLAPFGAVITQWEAKKHASDNPPPDGSTDPVVPDTITRRQCALQLLTMQMISADEALVMTRDGTPPAAVQAAFDEMPEPNRTMAMIDFAAINYYRSNQLIPSLMQANGMTEADVDAFFMAASAL